MLYWFRNATRDLSKKSVGAKISRILIVEDNHQNALLMKRVLGARNHQIIHAEDGESGLQAAVHRSGNCVA
jgi:CheY-like chemotaxis protein